MNKLNLLAVTLVFLVSGCISIGAEVETAKQNKLPILVRGLNTSLPNSAGGVDLSVRFVNTGTKAIRYITFEAIAFDRTGGIARDRLGRSSSVRYVGPLDPGEGAGGASAWRNVWYNNSIRCAEISRIVIEYMDGRRIDIAGSDISRHMGEDIRSCRP